MSIARPTTKTLRGKYQIRQNVHVACYLDVLDANDQEIRAFVGCKKRGDTTVPPGTRIYFDAETINRINERRGNAYDVYSVQVKAVEEFKGKKLHVCTPILKEQRENRRDIPRKEARFPITVSGSDVAFEVSDGNVQGLTLHCKTGKAILSLALEQPYQFTVSFRNQSYLLPGRIRHILYDWKRHEHVVGVHLDKLEHDLEVILNLLLDPDYKVEISQKQKVDTSIGKISAEDI